MICSDAQNLKRNIGLNEIQSHCGLYLSTVQRLVHVNSYNSHHVAEMEERLHQMETDRLQEHGAAELELDERHKMLQRLQHEAEMMKAEAQQVSAQGHRGEVEGQ